MDQPTLTQMRLRERLILLTRDGGSSNSIARRDTVNRVVWEAIGVESLSHLTALVPPLADGSLFVVPPGQMDKHRVSAPEKTCPLRHGLGTTAKSQNAAIDLNEADDPAYSAAGDQHTPFFRRARTAPLPKIFRSGQIDLPVRSSCQWPRVDTKGSGGVLVARFALARATPELRSW